MNCLVVGGYGVNPQPAQRGADGAVHLAGCLTLRAIFPQRRMQAAGVSPILRMARLCRFRIPACLAKVR